MSAIVDDHDVSAEAVTKPRRLPEDRLERAIYDYLAQNGPVLSLTDLIQMLWALSLPPLRVVPSNAVFHNIQDALFRLASVGWVELQVADDPKQFWLIPGVEQFRDDPPESFVGEKVVTPADEIIARATALLPILEAAPADSKLPELKASYRAHPPTADTRQGVLSYLVLHRGSCGRDDIADALEYIDSVMYYALHWFEAEGLIIRTYPNGKKKPPDWVLLPGGCLALIAILKGEPYVPPSGIDIDSRPVRHTVSDARAAKIIGLLADGEWHQFRLAELAERLGVTAPTLNVLINKMNDAGHIERQGSTSAMQRRATPAGLAWREQYLRDCPALADQDG